MFNISACQAIIIIMILPVVRAIQNINEIKYNTNEGNDFGVVPNNTKQQLANMWVRFQKVCMYVCIQTENKYE